MGNILELTDEAIVKLLEAKERDGFNYIRLGITGGGCAGFEYIFDSVKEKSPEDIVVDFGKLQFVIDKISVPYYATLHYKRSSIVEPDFYGKKLIKEDKWIVYPWERKDSKPIQDYLKNE